MANRIVGTETQKVNGRDHALHLSKENLIQISQEAEKRTERALLTKFGGLVALHALDEDTFWAEWVAAYEAETDRLIDTVHAIEVSRELPANNRW